MGLLVTDNVEPIRQFLNRLLHANLFPAELYFLSRLLSVVDPRDVASVVGMTLLLSILATLYPPGGPPSSILSKPCVTNEMSKAILQLENVERRFQQGESALCVLRDGNFGLSASLLEHPTLARSMLMEWHPPYE